MGLPMFCIPITLLELCSSGKLNLPISSGFKGMYLLLLMSIYLENSSCMSLSVRCFLSPYLAGKVL